MTLRRTLLLVLASAVGAAAGACSGSSTASQARDAGSGSPQCTTRQDCDALGALYKGLVCGSSGTCEGCGTDGQCELREMCDPEKRRCVFKPGWGTDCALNADCAAGQLCVQGLCVASAEVVLCVNGRCLADGYRCNKTNGVCEEDIGCLADADCGEVELCNVPTHSCVARCTPETQAEVCNPGQRCVNERCSECASNADCPSGLVCNLDQLRCILDGSEHCSSNRDCPVGMICNVAAGFCTPSPPPCLSNEDCAPGERCEVQSGKCVRRSCQPDKYEPNRDATSAPQLLAGTYTGLTLCDRQQDWFALRLSRGDRVSVFVDADPLLEDQMDTRLLDATGRVLAQGKLLLDRTVSSDATYNLRLQSTDAFVEYGLRIALARGTPCDDDAFEPNDESGSATALHAAGDYDGLSICGPDRDFFAVPVPAERGLAVDLSQDPTEGDLDLVVLAEDGVTELGRSATTASIESVALDAASVGGSAVFVGVLSSDSRAHASYLMRVRFTP